MSELSDDVKAKARKQARSREAHHRLGPAAFPSNTTSRTARAQCRIDCVWLVICVTPAGNSSHCLLLKAPPPPSAQVEFYFSDSNLPRDAFLRSAVEEAPDGFVSLALICTFSRMRSLLGLGDSKVVADKASATYPARS